MITSILAAAAIIFVGLPALVYLIVGIALVVKARRGTLR